MIGRRGEPWSTLIWVKYSWRLSYTHLSIGSEFGILLKHTWAWANLGPVDYRQTVETTL
jgi:hypothetical protein